jgi:hypothetical protein
MPMANADWIPLSRRNAVSAVVQAFGPLEPVELV